MSIALIHSFSFLYGIPLYKYITNLLMYFIVMDI